MSSHREGDLSAATQVKVLILEIFIIVRGQAFHFTETSNGRRIKGERGYGVPKSEPIAELSVNYVDFVESESDNQDEPAISRQALKNGLTSSNISIDGRTYER